MWVYNYKLQIKFAFCSGPKIIHLERISKLICNL